MTNFETISSLTPVLKVHLGIIEENSSIIDKEDANLFRATEEKLGLLKEMCMKGQATDEAARLAEEIRATIVGISNRAIAKSKGECNGT